VACDGLVVAAPLRGGFNGDDERKYEDGMFVCLLFDLYTHWGKVTFAATERWYSGSGQVDDLNIG
jgi:hypothetical protein